MNTLPKAVLAVLAAFSASPGLAQLVVGGTSFFTATRAQIEAASTSSVQCGQPGDPFNVCQTVLGATFSEAGSQSGAYGKARANFGVNGAYASVLTGQTDREAYGESIWSDAFVVRGGSGAATLQIVVRVDGVLDGQGRPGGPGSNASYRLFVSDAPITCDFDEASCTGLAAIPRTEPLSGTQYLKADIAFTYDKPFYLASYLGAEVIGGQAGVADFFHSAYLGISAPEGASLFADSGVSYAAASAVPEPASGWLVLAGGLVTLGLYVARREAPRS